MANFVLVHGAYHAAWCWQRVVPVLEQAGHLVSAPDLPGHGDDKAPPADVTMSSYAGRVAEVVAGFEAPVILVGHSMAGAVVAQAAELMPDRIAQVIFLTAYIPADGQSVADMVRQDTNVRFPVTRLEHDGVPCLGIEPYALGRHFYHDANPEDFAWLKDKVQTQPIAPFGAALNLSAENFDRVKKAYILCRDDRAIGFSLQRQMAARCGCNPVVTMKSGHSPFITAPNELCQLLLGLAGDSDN